MNISQIENTGLTILLYGGYGTGKTFFSSTLPQPIYIFDTDKGVRTVYNRLRSINRLRDAQIDFDIYTDSRDLNANKGLTYVKKSVMENIVRSPHAYCDLEKKLISMIEDDNCKYKTVVLDSLTSFSVIFLYWIIGLKPDQGRDRALPNLSDMGGYIRKLSEFIDLFHMLSDKGIITVVTAHAQLKEDIRGIRLPVDPNLAKKIRLPDNPEVPNMEYKGTWMLPSVIGKDLPFSLGRQFDEVYLTTAVRSGNRSIYRFETQSNEGQLCKTRSATMPAVIEQDWGKLSKHLNVRKETNND